jgi:hypothetical protein
MHLNFQYEFTRVFESKQTALNLLGVSVLPLIFIFLVPFTALDIMFWFPHIFSRVVKYRCLGILFDQDCMSCLLLFCHKYFYVHSQKRK